MCIFYLLLILNHVVRMMANEHDIAWYKVSIVASTDRSIASSNVTLGNNLMCALKGLHKEKLHNYVCFMHICDHEYIIRKENKDLLGKKS